MAPATDVDPKDIASSGWGVIFPQKQSPEVREALAPLIDYRRSQAARHREHYFRELLYIPGESKQGFLRRLKVEAGPAHPDKLPYYLLIVGDPATIPNRFQYLLDMQYAVGRICFESPEDYSRYAASVIKAEKGPSDVLPRMRLFAPGHDGDPAIRLVNEKLIQPLAGDLAKSHPHWDIQQAERSGKSQLRQLIGGKETPALLFSFSHGLALPSGHEHQTDFQGAILCQDWNGPQRQPRSLHRQHYFAASDVEDDARLHGIIAFLLGCYSAGTPRTDNYPPTRAFLNPRRPRSPRPFVSRLAQRLLSHPNGGALAVVGHIDRIWSRTFGSGLGNGYHHIGSCLKDLLDGYPVGAAMDWMNERFAELSTELCDVLDEYKEPLEAGGDEALSDPRRLASLWRANNDARNLVILGDPAVRLAARPTIFNREATRAPYLVSSADELRRKSTDVRRSKIFLCHATEDKPVVRDLSLRLREQGFWSWLDDEDLLPGELWRLEIDRAIRSSLAVIVCLSKISVKKEGFVQREIRRACDVADEKLEDSVFLIPAKLESCAIPDRLSHLHSVNVSTSSGFDKLVRALRKRYQQLS